MKSINSQFRIFYVIFIGITIVAVLLNLSCTQKVNDLERLAEWMSGSFSSVEQAARDSNFFDIRLQMMPIWKDRTDGIWLYVEQAAADYLDKPYRQRVYKLLQEDENTFMSMVYTLNDPLRFAGAWQDETPLAGLTPDSLTEREGCAIILKKEGSDVFTGSTVDKNCSSNLRGASYATSEVTIRPTELISWDRGFDAEDNQVWGAATGGYIFKKTNKNIEK